MSKKFHYQALVGQLVVEGEMIRGNIATDQANFKQVQTKKLQNARNRMKAVREKAASGGLNMTQLVEIDSEIVKIDGAIAAL